MGEYKKLAETWAKDWKEKEEMLVSEGWIKITDSEPTCNTPVYQKDKYILHLDCNFGDCSHFQIEGRKMREFTLENLKDLV